MEFLTVVLLLIVSAVAVACGGACRAQTAPCLWDTVPIRACPVDGDWEG